MPTSSPKLGVLIRFKDSATTLPEVLASLERQTRRPDLLVGVDTGSKDNSPQLIEGAGGSVVAWRHPYSHPAVLNFGLQHCPAELVLVLSSHTTMESPDTLERLCAGLADPQCACASLKWDDDPFYSDAVTLAELRQKGMKLGSIYSNSLGLLRRSCWEQEPFDESLLSCEDYAWAVAMLTRGYHCRRLKLSYRYLRATGDDRTAVFTSMVFATAKKHGLKVIWLGPKATLATMLQAGLRTPFSSQSRQDFYQHWQRLRVWMRFR